MASILSIGLDASGISAFWVAIVAVFAFWSFILTSVGCGCCQRQQKAKKNRKYVKEEDKKIEISKETVKAKQNTKSMEALETAKLISKDATPVAKPKVPEKPVEIPKIVAKSTAVPAGTPKAVAEQTAQDQANLDFAIPAFTIMKDKDFCDTIVDLQGHQDFMPTICTPRSGRKGTKTMVATARTVKAVTLRAKRKVGRGERSPDLAKTAIDACTSKMVGEDGSVQSFFQKNEALTKVAIQSTAADPVGVPHQIEVKDKRKGTKTKHCEVAVTKSTKTQYADDGHGEMQQREGGGTHHAATKADARHGRNEDKKLEAPDHHLVKIPSKTPSKSSPSQPVQSIFF